MKQYRVVALRHGFLSRALTVEKLQRVLDDHAVLGWHLSRSVRDHQRMLLFFKREVNFLIFERSVGGAEHETTELLQQLQAHMESDPTPHLLRQLLRAYGIEPEA